MNARRAAALLRELADLDARRSELQRELAETMAAEDPSAPTPANDTRKRTRKAVPLRVPTDVEITDVDRANAARTLRRMGMRVR